MTWGPCLHLEDRRPESQMANRYLIKVNYNYYVYLLNPFFCVTIGNVWRKCVLIQFKWKHIFFTIFTIQQFCEAQVKMLLLGIAGPHWSSRRLSWPLPGLVCDVSCDFCPILGQDGPSAFHKYKTEITWYLTAHNFPSFSKYL